MNALSEGRDGFGLRAIPEFFEFDPHVVELFDSLPDSVAIVARDGSIRHVNRQLEVIFGFDRQQLLGRSVEVLLPKALHEVHRRHRSGYAAAPRVRTMGGGLELRAVRADGSEVPVEISLSPINSLGEPMVVAAIRDVTARHEADEERRRLVAELSVREEKFRLAFDQAPVGMALTSLADPARREIIEVNAALADMLGYSPAELIGTSFADVTHPDDRETNAVDARRLGESSDQLLREKRYVARDGSTIWAELHAARMTDSTGGLLSVAHVVDLRERKAREDEQLRNARFLDALAQVTTGLLAGAEGTETFGLVAFYAAWLLGADGAAVTGLDGDDVEALGIKDDHFHLSPTMRLAADESTTAEVIRTGQARRIDVEPEPAAPVLDGMLAILLVAPLSLPSGRAVAVTVGFRRGAPPPDAHALVLLERYLAQCSLALELAHARSDQRRLAVTEDRERIARDLHDRVIQRLFGIGMSMHSVTGGTTAMQEQIDDAVGQIDAAIKELRTVIFSMTHTTNDGLRSRLLEITDRHSRHLLKGVGLTFEGPVELLDHALADELCAVLTEALSNVVRHAEAAQAEASLIARDGRLVLRVVDDGIGFRDEATRGNGLDNLAARAGRHGGTFVLRSNPLGGSVFEWSVPIRA